MARVAFQKHRTRAKDDDSLYPRYRTRSIDQEDRSPTLATNRARNTQVKEILHNALLNYPAYNILLLLFESLIRQVSDGKFVVFDSVY